jgi:hypothetical protein
MKTYNDKSDFMDDMRSRIAPALGIEEEETYTLSMVSYLTHMAGELYEQAAEDSRILHREMYPITAMIPENMYKFASSGSVTDITATPAFANCYAYMSISDILANATYESGKYVYIMEDFAVTVDDEYVFTALYPVEISLSKNVNGDYSCTAKYNIDTVNPISTITNPYLKAMKQGSDGVLIEISLRQYEVKSVDKTFLNTNSIETSTFRVTYDDQLADFRALYAETSSSDLVSLAKTMTFDYTAGYDTVFYKYISSNEISILFKKSAFYPAVNSTVYIEAYYTKGAAGNFLYDGQDVSYDYTATYGDKVTLDILMDDSRLGTDAPTLEELRATTIDYRKRRVSIVSESDLQEHYTNNSSVEYTIIKRKHDSINMNYEIYAKLMTSTGMVIPTNTVDITIDDTMWDVDRDNNRMLHDFALIELDGSNGNYKSKVVDRIADNGRVDESDKSKFYYTIPFLIHYQTEYNITSLYEGEVDRSYPLESVDSNSTATVSYIINNINCIRKSGEKKYRFQFNLLTNHSEPVEGIHGTDDDGNIIDLEYIKVFVVLGASFKGYVNATMLSYNDSLDYYVYEAEVDLTDMCFDIEEKMNMSVLYAGETIETSIAIEDLYVTIHVYSQEVVDTQFVESRISIADGYYGINKYSATVTLFENYTENIKTVSVLGDGSIEILKVPVIRYNMYRIDDYRESIVELISYEISNVEELYLQTEMNYDLFLWFYNTYGIPDNMVIGSGSSFVPMGRTNIDLDFNVALVYGATLTPSIIKEYIKDYIENIKYTESETFHVSQLITDIKSSYSDIDYIEFNGINSSGAEKQLMKASVEKDEFEIPEDVCVSLLIDEYDSITLDITLNFF